MTVYVDAIQQYSTENMDAHTRSNGDLWSHMWADIGCVDELHDIATTIGLKLSWFQTKSSLYHYDITPPKRTLAIKCGAVEMHLRDWMRNNRLRRSEWNT